MGVHRLCQIWEIMIRFQEWENTFVGVEKTKLERVQCVSASVEKSLSNSWGACGGWIWQW